MPQKEEAAHAFAVAATLSLGTCSEALQFCLKIDNPDSCGYCSSLSTSCCTLLAWASAAMPVWLRISNFDMFEVAEA
jgi:hypothetical protein